MITSGSILNFLTWICARDLIHFLGNTLPFALPKVNSLFFSIFNLPTSLGLSRKFKYFHLTDEILEARKITWPRLHKEMVWNWFIWLSLIRYSWNNSLLLQLIDCHWRVYKRELPPHQSFISKQMPHYEKRLNIKVVISSFSVIYACIM